MNEIKLNNLNKIWTNLKSQFYHFSQNKNYIYIYIYIYIWKLKEGKEESGSVVFTSNSWRLYYIIFLLNNWRKNIPPAYGSLAEKTWCFMGGMRSVHFHQNHPSQSSTFKKRKLCLSHNNFILRKEISNFLDCSLRVPLKNIHCKGS